ncbi:MAG TPA: HEAT repeat domain-containing protein, partial [Clostridiaceae bacterium]|nr:HEAT repeat domain-containing protein [Clostridiaceae bacterium]
IRRKFSEGFFDFTDVHSTVIALSDLTRFCKYSNRMSEHAELLKISEDFFYSLFIQVHETVPVPASDADALTNDISEVSIGAGQSGTQDKEGTTAMSWEAPKCPVDGTIAGFYTVITSETAKITEKQNALRCLRKHLHAPGAFDLAVYCLTTSKNTNIQKEAIKLLAHLRDERAVEPLITAYGQVGVILSVEVIRALGSIGSHEAVPLLLEVLNQKRFENRIAAIKALGQIRDPRAVPPLIQCLLEPKSEIQRYATIALGDIGDTAAGPALINLLYNSTSVVRIEAIRALVKLEYNQAIPVLRQLRDDRSRAVRDEVEKSLELLSVT